MVWTTRRSHPAGISSGLPLINRPYPPAPHHEPVRDRRPSGPASSASGSRNTRSLFSVIFLSGGDHVFGYRRHSFNSALAQLSILRANPGNLEALLCLQEVLIAEITLAETRVQETKRQAARSEGKRSLYLAARVKALQQSIYYWKMIGDAVAFLYLDRFALKHVYYNTDNPYPRNDAGFLTGSRGFDLEVKIARNLIQSGYPCLLTDLTNTVRHGDICLLHGSDPTLIEGEVVEGQEPSR